MIIGNLILNKINQETEDVKTLFFELENNEKLDFEAGQFLDLFKLDNKDSHGKPYTISSAPFEDLIQITVKKMGKFSEWLHNIKTGDRVKFMGPNGYLTLSEIDDKSKDIVFIAAGIGITPFFSIIKDVFNKKLLSESHLVLKNNQKISLFYSSQNKEKIIFNKELKEFQKNNGNFKFYNYLSKEDNSDKSFKNRRLKINDLENNLINLKNKSFFICGSVQYVDDFWRKLKNKGVKEENIFTEVFFI